MKIRFIFFTFQNPEDHFCRRETECGRLALSLSCLEPPPIDNQNDHSGFVDEDSPQINDYSPMALSNKDTDDDDDDNDNDNNIMPICVVISLLIGH